MFILFQITEMLFLVVLSDNNPGLAYITSKQYAVKYEVC